MKPTEKLSRNTETVADSLAAIIKRELTELTTTSNLNHHEHEGYFHPSDPNMISVDDRTKLVDWCYHVVDHCQFSRETVASAMDMVDRFFSMPSNSVDAARVSDEALRDKSQFQLLTIAALYSSIKVHERVALSSDQFAEIICSRAYTAEEIEDMERILLSGLSWRCHSPTAHHIGLSILSLLLPYVDIPEVTWGFIIDEMKYLTELAVRDYYFAVERTSTIALAAIFNVISDTSTKERQEILTAFLRIIMECFQFDHSKNIAAARTRLRCLVTPDIPLQEDDVEGRSLDESEKTYKVSNSSSCPKRDLGVISGVKRGKLGHELEHVVSPVLSLRDVY